MFNGIVLSSCKSSCMEQNSWKLLWVECGKCCYHIAKSLKVVSPPKEDFNNYMYKDLCEDDYFETKSSFFQVNNQNEFTTGFRVNSNQSTGVETSTVMPTDGSSLVSTPIPSADRAAVATLL